MRALRSLVLPLCLLALSTCQKGPESSRTPDRAAEAVPEIRGMPDPLPLPAQPPAGVVHIEDPLSVAYVAATYGGGVVPPVTELLNVLASSLTGALEQQIVPHLALDRPWDGAQISGQTILHVPVRRESKTQVAALLAPLAAEGTFGAKRIPRAPGDKGPSVAYLDTQRDVLTLAHDLRGIATGYALGTAYGEPAIRVRLDATTAAQWGVELAFDSIEITGSDPQRLQARLRGPHPSLPIPVELEAGALTGMLESRVLTLGVSSRYADHEQEVAKLHQELRREIANQSFFIRGTLEDLFQRFVSLSRHWNGRVMVGVAPAHHVLLGLGADQAQSAGNAALHLLAGILENLKLAQSLGLGASVPELRFARNTAKVGPIAIHALTVRNAQRHLPRDLAPLLDPQGSLKLAWATTEHTGGAMAVAGPDAPGVLQRWLTDAQNATAAAQSRAHWAAATVAVNPAQVQHVLANPYAVLLLKPTQSPLRIVVERRPDGYDLSVQPG